MRYPIAAVLPLLLAAAASCNADPAGVDLPDADTRVLFVGNSLTYGQDVPGQVQRLADAAGLSVAHAAITAPDFSLEDHWHAGLKAQLARLRPDIVVLQQGPSSLPANQAHLARWTDSIARVLQPLGGRVALYMVWPDASRRPFFPDVRDAYRNAANAVDGLFIPAGMTWLELEARAEPAPLYAPDGLHASRLGATAAAHTIFAVLFDLRASDIPVVDDGLDAGTRVRLAASVQASIDQWTRR